LPADRGCDPCPQGEWGRRRDRTAQESLRLPANQGKALVCPHGALDAGRDGPGVWVAALDGIAGTHPAIPDLGATGRFRRILHCRLGEELGWMGYAVDPMQARWNALQAGILLGLAWAAWHIIPVVQVGRSPVWIAWQCLFWVASRILIVWLYNNSGKSLFSMALFHSTFGLFWILLPATDNLQKATPYYDPRLAAIIAISYVAIVTLLWGSKTLAQYRFARSSESYVTDKNQLVTAGTQRSRYDFYKTKGVYYDEAKYLKGRHPSKNWRLRFNHRGDSYGDRQYLARVGRPRRRGSDAERIW